VDLHRCRLKKIHYFGQGCDEKPGCPHSSFKCLSFRRLKRCSTRISWSKLDSQGRGKLGCDRVNTVASQGGSEPCLGFTRVHFSSTGQILTGHLRVSPPPPPPAGLFPFLTLANPPRDPYSSVSSVSFANRQYASTGDFYDYSARYGALRDEDCTTLRQSMFIVPLNTTPLPSTRTHDHALLERLADKLDLTSLLDLPLVALSNGQTRRSRILKALLDKPELLLLDEPLSTSNSVQVPR
jgi:hypothetical protein